MSLEDLLKIGQLKRHPPDRDEVRRLLAAAERNPHDAILVANSPETRFDCACKAAMQPALAALMAHGYRPMRSGGTPAAGRVQGADREDAPKA